MKKFIVERNVPGAGNLSPAELEAISRTSVDVMNALGKPYRWIHSFVTENNIYCIHEAEDENVIREHSSCANFHVSTIKEIKDMIDPTTADR